MDWTPSGRSRAKKTPNTCNPPETTETIKPTPTSYKEFNEENPRKLNHPAQE